MRSNRGAPRLLLVNYPHMLQPSSRKSIHRWCAVLMRLAVVLAASSAGDTLAQNSSRQQSDSITLQGTVRNPASQPVAGATVVLEDKDSRKSSETKTNADGTFFLAVGHPGTFLVKVEKAELHNRGTIVTFSAGEKKQLDLI